MHVWMGDGRPKVRPYGCGVEIVGGRRASEELIIYGVGDQSSLRLIKGGFIMGRLLSDIPNGRFVKLNENTKPTKFIKLDNDHYGEGTGVTLIRNGTFTDSAWGASGDRYEGCLLDNFCDGIWPQKLDKDVQALIIPVPIASESRTIYRKGFALSSAEVGFDGGAEGTAFEYFSDNSKRSAYFEDTYATANWGLRTVKSSYQSYYVRYDGYIRYDSVSDWEFAPRPAFNLPGGIIVSDAPDADDCYVVESLPTSGGGVYIKENGVWVKAM